MTQYHMTLRCDYNSPEGIVVGGAGKGEPLEVLRDAIAAIREELQDPSIPVVVQGMDNLRTVNYLVNKRFKIEYY